MLYSPQTREFPLEVNLINDTFLRLKVKPKSLKLLDQIEYREAIKLQIQSFRDCSLPIYNLNIPPELVFHHQSILQQITEYRRDIFTLPYQDSDTESQEREYTITIIGKVIGVLNLE